MNLCVFSLSLIYLEPAFKQSEASLWHWEKRVLLDKERETIDIQGFKI